MHPDFAARFAIVSRTRRNSASDTIGANYERTVNVIFGRDVAVIRDHLDGRQQRGDCTTLAEWRHPLVHRLILNSSRSYILQSHDRNRSHVPFRSGPIFGNPTRLRRHGGDRALRSAFSRGSSSGRLNRLAANARTPRLQYLGGPSDGWWRVRAGPASIGLNDWSRVADPGWQAGCPVTENDFDRWPRGGTLSRSTRGLQNFPRSRRHPANW